MSAKTSLVALAVGLSLAVAGPALAHERHGYHGYHGGYGHHGPCYDEDHYARRHHMMPRQEGMMGPGMMGGGMMGGDMMGRGMTGGGMMGGDMMGRGMMGGPAGEALTPDVVRQRLSRFIEWQGNSRLKVGEVAETQNNTIIAEIVTQDDSLVERLEIDPATGWMRRLP